MEERKRSGSEMDVEESVPMDDEVVPVPVHTLTEEEEKLISVMIDYIKSKQINLKNK
jgi:hypothetical protein